MEEKPKTANEKARGNANIFALERGKIFPLLLKYSLPAIAGLVVVSLYNIIDSIFIGYWIGPDGLAGTAISFPVMNITAALGTLVGIGGSVATSIFLGEKKFFKANQVLGQSFVMSMVFGIVIGGLSIAFLDPILRLFGASETVVPYAHKFMFPLLLTQWLTYYFFNLNHIMRASGYPGKAMCSMMISAVLNVLFAPIFLGLGWGIAGVAWATVVAQGIGALWIFVHFINPKNVVHFCRGIFKPEFPLIRHMCFVGLPPSILNLVGCFVVIVINWQLAMHGGDTSIAANGIYNRCVMLVGFCIVGIAQGAQPIIGFNFGANRPNRVRKTLYWAILLGTIVSTTLGLLSVAFPRVVAHCFTNDPALLDAGAEAMRFGTLAMPIVGVQIITVNFFQSIGKAPLAILLSFTRQAAFLIPFLLIFPRYWDTMGVWLAFPCADAIAAILAIALLLWYLRGYNASHEADAVTQKILAGTPEDAGTQK